MNRKLFQLIVILLVTALVGGCRWVGMPSWGGGGAPADPWPPATSDWADSGALAGAVDMNPETSPAILSKLYTRSDGQNLYVKVTYDTVGYGFNFFLLVDNVRVDNGYNPSRWNSHFTTWWGSMGLKFEKNGTMFFSPDLVVLRAREWDGERIGMLVEDDWGKIDHAVVGPSEEDFREVDVTVEQNADGSEYVITIPYASIGMGARSGDRLQIIAMVGRDTWLNSEGEFLEPSERPLGIQTAIPFSGVITDEGTPEARISYFNSAVLVTLK